MTKTSEAESTRLDITVCDQLLSQNARLFAMTNITALQTAVLAMQWFGSSLDIIKSDRNYNNYYLSFFKNQQRMQISITCPLLMSITKNISKLDSVQKRKCNNFFPVKAEMLLFSNLKPRTEEASQSSTFRSRKIELKLRWRCNPPEGYWSFCDYILKYMLYVHNSFSSAKNNNEDIIYSTYLQRDHKSNRKF